MDAVLIDSDVLLDVFFERKEFVTYASKLLLLCEQKQIKGYITPVIVSNIYYLLRQKNNHKKVIDHLKQLLQIVDIISIDKNTILQALHSNFKDFEDALQNYAAEKKNKIAIIITRNLKDYKKSNLGVFTPETYLKTKFIH